MKLLFNWAASQTLNSNPDHPNNRMNPTTKAAIEIPIVT